MRTNAAIFARRESAVARGIGHATPVAISRALNAEIWDVEGRRYVDFAGGIAVLNTGHCHPRIVAAARRQMEQFTHSCFQVLVYESYVELAERLNAVAPIPAPAKTAFFTTGAEATENAVKIARAATRRNGVIAFTGGFHGRTVMAMNLTGKVEPYKKGLGPAQSEIWHVPFPMHEEGVTTKDALRQLGYLFAADVDASAVAAIIIEPVLGEGGFHQAPADLMIALRRVCNEHGILLIADEVQTGFGRTGKMFAMEHYDVRPDIVCVGKSLAGGFPLSGVIGRAEIMDAVGPGGLGGTYAGNPLGCASALAVLDVIAEQNLLDRANDIGHRLKRGLHAFEGRADLAPITGLRGPGAMVAFDIVKNHVTREPDPATTKRVVRLAWENGLVLLSCGIHASTIRILVPLTASDGIVDEGVAIIGEILQLAMLADAVRNDNA